MISDVLLKPVLGRGGEVLRQSCVPSLINRKDKIVLFDVGAIPKVSSSSRRPRASSSTSTQSSQGATNTGAASFATANSNNQDDSLYCDVCKVYLNAEKQLVQHLGGSKHIAKQAEYMRNQQSGLAAGKPAENSANCKYLN